MLPEGLLGVGGAGGDPDVAEGGDASRPPTGAAASGQPVVVVAGDSVPERMPVGFATAGRDRGLTFVLAAHGGCTVAGESPAIDGEVLHVCPPDVPDHQDELIAEHDPDLVVWWDRFSIADVVAEDGTYVEAGTDEFWRIRRSTLAATVERLAAGGAVVVLVGVEPPGMQIQTPCTGSQCSEAWRSHLRGAKAVAQRWNWIMKAYARSHPDLARYVSIAARICHPVAWPCRDPLADGTPARPDGIHYKGQGEVFGARAVAGRLMGVLTALDPGG
jgi:hypothetical protein